LRSVSNSPRERSQPSVGRTRSEKRLSDWIVCRKEASGPSSPSPEKSSETASVALVLRSQKLKRKHCAVNGARGKRPGPADRHAMCVGKQACTPKCPAVGGDKRCNLEA